MTERNELQDVARAATNCSQLAAAAGASSRLHALQPQARRCRCAAPRQEAAGARRCSRAAPRQLVVLRCAAAGSELLTA